MNENLKQRTKPVETCTMNLMTRRSFPSRCLPTDNLCITVAAYQLAESSEARERGRENNETNKDNTQDNDSSNCANRAEFAFKRKRGGLRARYTSSANVKAFAVMYLFAEAARATSWRAGYVPPFLDVNTDEGWIRANRG